MKGIIFSLLEDVVSDDFGADTWDDVVERAHVTGAYSAIGSYHDHEFVELLGALPDSVGDGTGARLRWFGERAMPLLAARYPVFFTPHTSMTTYLPTLNDVIHPEVRKLYPGAQVPVFEVSHPTDDGVDLTYRSHRGLCALAEGFVVGAAGVFGQRAAVHQSRCTLTGASECLIVCRFASDGDVRVPA